VVNVYQRDKYLGLPAFRVRRPPRPTGAENIWLCRPQPLPNRGPNVGLLSNPVDPRFCLLAVLQLRLVFFIQLPFLLFSFSYFPPRINSSDELIDVHLVFFSR